MSCETDLEVNPIHAVDLGLSVKWAWCNVGANRPEVVGDKYAWGETTTKYTYEQSNYKYYNSSIRGYEDIGADISGTSFDVARVILGDGWRMPTNEEIQELIECCIWEKAYLCGESGMFVTGPNGNRIFLPNASGYWSGTFSSEEKSYKYVYFLKWKHSLPWLNEQDADVRLSQYPCFHGLAIRPVKNK